MNRRDVLKASAAAAAIAATDRKGIERRRPKNRRAGCILCKPHKANGAKNREPAAAVRQTQVGRDER